MDKTCPKLANRKHGSYSIRQELPPREDGTRRSFNRPGYESLKATQVDLDQVLVPLQRKASGRKKRSDGKKATARNDAEKKRKGNGKKSKQKAGEV